MNEVTNEVIDVVEEVQQEDIQEETGIVQQAPSLNEESLALIEKIIIENDEQKTRDLTHLFNVNQNKKNYG
jgi:Mg/Co/Ni transporter MgtE